MMTFDMTAQLTPVFVGLVALLALSSAAIVANAMTPHFLARWTKLTRRDKRRVTRHGTVVHASA